jgi:hypothetical protein
MRGLGYGVFVVCGLLAVGAVGQNADRFSLQVVGGSGFVDGVGKIVIPPKYTQVREFHEGVAAVMRDGKWGYVDSAGVEVVALIYRGAQDFSEGVGLVMDDAGHTGSVDHQWHMKILDCIPITSDDFASYVPPPFSEGLTEFASGQETVYIDHACNRVIVQPGAGEPFADGLAAVRIGQKAGYIDHTGKLAIPMNYTFGCGFHEGMACVDIGGGRGYIDRSGKMVIQPQFGPKSRDFSEGVAAVQIDDKMGYIDKSDKVVIPPRFDEAYDFSEGLAQVRNQAPTKTKGGGVDIKSGDEDIFFIDRSGNIGISTHFQSVFGEGFKGGLVYVTDHGRDAYLNRQGAIVFPH